MKSSGVQPTSKSHRSGGWRDSKSHPALVGHRRPEKPGAAFGGDGKTDTSSFSELMQQYRQGETGRQSYDEDAELQTLFHVMSSNNDKIRAMALSLSEPIPKSDALLDSAMARTRVERYWGYQSRGYK